jgi:hypothetical protein
LNRERSIFKGTAIMDAIFKLVSVSRGTASFLGTFDSPTFTGLFAQSRNLSAREVCLANRVVGKVMGTKAFPDSYSLMLDTAISDTDAQYAINQGVITGLCFDSSGLWLTDRVSPGSPTFNIARADGSLFAKRFMTPEQRDAFHAEQAKFGALRKSAPSDRELSASMPVPRLPAFTRVPDFFGHLTASSRRFHR